MKQYCQIVMCTNARPNFNTEEVASVANHQLELRTIAEEMADHLPIEDPNKGLNIYNIYKLPYHGIIYSSIYSV